MLKIKFILVNLQSGNRTNHTRNIRREEYLDWMDKEGQVQVINGNLVRLVNLTKHTVIQYV